MKFIWCDTETTGLDTSNAAPFQVAMVFVSNVDGIKDESERVFYLNPFDISGVEYNEDAGKVHGYSKETIQSFEESKYVVPKIDEFLKSCVSFRKEEKLFFCGYNAKFDMDHLKNLFSKNGYNFEKYFEKQILDVFNQVKVAGSMRVLPYLENRKLTTIAKHLGVNLENAHDALGDIKATREVAKSLAKMGVALQ